MRHSHGIILVLALAGAAFAATWAVSARRLADQAPQRQETAALVARLGLTDLALVNEARYTRHPSQADRATAFQNHPLALDPFPSGSVIAPARQP